MTTPSDRPASEDFPQTEGAKFAHERPEYFLMCAEINRLRQELKAYKRVAAVAILDRCRPVLEALEHYDKTGEMP